MQLRARGLFAPVFVLALIAGTVISLHIARFNTTLLVVLLSIACVIFCVYLAVFYYTIKKPLNKITEALSSNNLPALQSIAAHENSFGVLARQVIQASAQQVQLDTEIGERIRQEKRSLEVEKQYRLLFDNTLDAIICTDSQGSITRCNQQALTLFKAAGQEILAGKALSGFLDTTGKTVIASFFSDKSTAVASCDFECTLTDTCDSPTNVIIRYTINNATPQPEVQFCIRDISAIKELTSGKARIEKHLQHLLKMEAIGQLANGIAHEYNNIFGAMSGYADLIKHHYAADARLQRYARMIHSGTKRASLLTSKMLTFAHIKKTVKNDFDTYALLSEIGDLLACTLPQSINLSVSSSGEAGLINGDQEQFRSAVTNIAVNAAKTMPDGGKLSIHASTFSATEDTARMFPAAVTGKRYVTITFTDTGTGISETTQARFFEPLRMSESDNEGYDLGLATVYGTIMSHDGFVDVASTPGEGSTVTLYFPMISIAPPAMNLPSLTGGKMSILAADDEISLRETLTDMLELLGYEVTMCSDGMQALEVFGSHPDAFDLIMLDMNMPGILGLDCFRKMREIKSDVRALIMTGYYLNEESQEILNTGICGMILKPFIIEELDDVLKKALAFHPA